MKLLLVSSLWLVSLQAVFAQEKPQVEVFGGYSYAAIAPNNFADRLNTNGGHTNVTINGSFMGFTADFSAHKAKSSITNATTYNFMIGPRFSRSGEKVSWFVHSLYGVSTARTDVPLISLKQSRTGFAYVPGGGGVDVKLNNRIAIRLFQFDLLFLKRTYPTPSISPRISTGIVIRWGGK